MNLQLDLCIKRANGSAVHDAYIACELFVSQLVACRLAKAAKYAQHTSALGDYLNSTNIEFDGIVIRA